MLLWIPVLEEYGPDIDYIQNDTKIVAYALSIFPINGNQEIKQESTYKTEIVPVD